MAGRGGAGNIEAANRRISQDLEANRSLAEANSDTSPLAQTLDIDRREQDAAHYGRGGAGNTFSPSALAQTGSFNTVEHTPDESRTAHERGTSSGMRGRGGAGNYAYTGDQAEDSREPLTGASLSNDLRARAERDVEQGLSRPGKAYLGGKEREAKKNGESIPGDAGAHA